MVVEPAVDMATEEATEPWAVVPWAEPGTSLPRVAGGALSWRKFTSSAYYLLYLS